MFQGVGLGCLAGLAFVQGGCTSDGPHGTGSVRNDGGGDAAEHVKSVAGAILVSKLPQGKELWSEAVSDGGGERLAQPSRPLIADGAVYVSGRGEVSACCLKDGELLAENQLDDMDYSGVRTALAEGLMLMAYGDGSMVAFDAGDLSVIWRKRYDFVQGVRETGSGTREDGSSYVTSEKFDADWYATDITVHEDAAVIGFSSYQTNPGSYLLCIELASGTVRWQKEYQGRFCYFAGVSHPYATPAGVLVSIPEKPCLQLLDYTDGNLLGELTVDTFIGMGFSLVPGTEDEYLTVTRGGYLLHLRVSTTGIEQRASTALPVSDGAERVIMPSCAQPIVVGDVAVCNLPVPPEIRSDGHEVPKEGTMGGIAVLALDTLDIMSQRSGFSFSATPVGLQAKNDTVPYLYYLQDDGLYRLAFADGDFGEPKPLNEDVHLGLDTQCGPFAVDEGGCLALVCGDANLQRLHVLC